MPSAVPHRRLRLHAPILVCVLSSLACGARQQVVHGPQQQPAQALRSEVPAVALPDGPTLTREPGGPLPKPVIQTYIATQMDAIKACYQTALAVDAELQGELKVKFLIAGVGTVHRVLAVENTLDNADAVACVLAQIATWRFPSAPGGGVTSVVYPFVFRTR